MELKDVKTFLLDMDGTFYLGVLPTAHWQSKKETEEKV